MRDGKPVQHSFSTKHGVTHMKVTKSLEKPGVRRGSPNRNGEGGIRTLVTVSGKPVFETSAFNHSATSPIGVRL